MKNLNNYIIERLRINDTTKLVENDALKYAVVFKQLKKLTGSALGLQDWHSKDYSTRIVRGGLFTVHFNCQIEDDILKRVWKYLFDEYNKYGKGLITDDGHDRYVSGKTCIFTMNTDKEYEKIK